MPAHARRRRRLAPLLAAAALLVGVTALTLPQGAANAVTAPTCGGEVPAHKSTGAAWVCSFDDEFNGSALDTSKWTVQLTALGGYTTGTPSARPCYINSPSTVLEAGGYLALAVNKNTTAMKCGTFSSKYTAGSVSGLGKFSQAYGRFEIRAKFPATTVRGLHEALWMFPSNATKYGTQARTGEIDIAEVYSNHSTMAVPTIHYLAKKNDPNATSYKCNFSASAFHTYTLVWTTTSMTIAIDGATCITDVWNPAAPLKAPQPFDQPFFTVLTAGLGQNADSYVGTAPLPATTLIDYVRAWK